MNSEDDLCRILQIVKFKIWTRFAMNRSRWSETVEQARTHQGLLSLTRNKPRWN
jgi:hypothetical protein